MSDSVKPNDAQQPDATAAPVAVVVIPAAGLSDELRHYLSLRRDALIQELRALDRVLGRPQTVPTRQR
jgi:hypothetical protein